MYLCKDCLIERYHNEPVPTEIQGTCEYCRQIKRLMWITLVDLRDKSYCKRHKYYHYGVCEICQNALGLVDRSKIRSREWNVNEPWGGRSLYS